MMAVDIGTLLVERFDAIEVGLDQLATGQLTSYKRHEYHRFVVSKMLKDVVEAIKLLFQFLLELAYFSAEKSQRF